MSANHVSDGILADPSGTLIYKPCTAAEIDFYHSAVAEHPELARLMPTFMGTLQRGRTEQLETILAGAQQVSGAGAGVSSFILPTPDLEQCCGKEAEENTSLKGKKLDTDLVLVLENVLSGFTRPNFMDVKLGKRLWADDAPPAKRARFDDISSKTTSSTLGFRVAGMQIWEPSVSEDAQENGTRDSMSPPGEAPDALETPKGSYRVYDKLYGRALTKDNVHDAFKKLFCVGADDLTEEYLEDIIRDVDSSIEEIESIIASKESRMYSASLLLVFEGDADTRRKLIDAAVEKALRAQEKQSRRAESTEGMRSEVEDGGWGAEEDEEYDEDMEDDDEEEEPKLFDIRVIDFAHAAWTPGQGRDENMLYGIGNVRKVVQRLVGSHTPGA